MKEYTYKRESIMMTSGNQDKNKCSTVFHNHNATVIYISKH